MQHLQQQQFLKLAFNIQNLKEDEDGDVIMIIENDVEMEEIPEYPEDVEMEDLSVYPAPVNPAPVNLAPVYPAKKLLGNEGQETRDGKLTGKKKGKKNKNKLNKSC